MGICMFMMCTSMEYKEYKNEIKFERNACFWCNVSTVPNNFYLACSLLDICGQNQEEKLKLYKVLWQKIVNRFYFKIPLRLKFICLLIYIICINW